MQHDNPFITPDNPTGQWDAPFEPAHIPDVRVEGLMADSVNVTAGSVPTPLGVMPVLVLDFHNSAGGSAPRIIFVAGDKTMHNFARLINQSVDAATAAAVDDASEAGQ